MESYSALAASYDELTQDELIYTHLVRATDIDMGRHMNNVVYIRLLLDCLPAKELASGRIKNPGFFAPSLMSFAAASYMEW